MRRLQRRLQRLNSTRPSNLIALLCGLAAAVLAAAAYFYMAVPHSEEPWPGGHPGENAAEAAREGPSDP